MAEAEGTNERRVLRDLWRSQEVPKTAAAKFVIAAQEAAATVRRRGPAELLRTILRSDPLLTQQAEYELWCARYDRLSDADRTAIQERQARFPARPLISVVMPVYDPPEFCLRRAVDSVRKQLYPNWELCIADDASSDSRVRVALDELLRLDPRIHVVLRKERGNIGAASNSALELASGEFVAFLDHDDELAEHALYMVAEELNRHPETDLLYTDHDKIDLAGNRSAPYFKPDWNPDLFFGQNYLNHLTVLRTQLVRDVGCFRQGFDASQDYDLLLRCVDATAEERIRHVPHVLYHWRALPGSAAHSPAAKPHAPEAARAALRSHFGSSPGVEIRPSALPMFHRVVRPLPSPAPAVTIVTAIPDLQEVDSDRLARLVNRTTYRPLRVLVVAPPGRTLPAVAATEGLEVLTCGADEQPASRRNLGARASDGEILVFLDSCAAFPQAGWLEEMVRESLRPEIGVVGAKLGNGHGRISSGGRILGGRALVQDAHTGARLRSSSQFGRCLLVTNVSAVAGACMALRRDVFHEVGGFDQDHFPCCLFDLDLCLRVRRRGYLVLWTPFAEVTVRSTGGNRDATAVDSLRLAAEKSALRSRWAAQIEEDSYYNPNLSLDPDRQFRPAFPPRVTRPWTTLLEETSDRTP